MVSHWSSVALLLVFISAVAAFAPRRQFDYDPYETYYNGTETYDATVIMISLDGFRADYLNRNNTSTLARLGNDSLFGKCRIRSHSLLTETI